MYVLCMVIRMNLMNFKLKKKLKKGIVFIIFLNSKILKKRKINEKNKRKGKIESK